MKTNIPNFSFGAASFKYPILGLLVGFVSYQLGAEYFESIMVGVLVPLLVLVGITQVRISKFKKYISSYGAPTNSDKLESEYSTTLVGLIPFKGRSVACTVYVGRHGLAFGRLGVYRKLVWEEIASLKSSYYLGQHVAELSINEGQTDNPLVVPWSKAANEYLPL